MDIDLNKHAVIEASAGTGKTYTIEQIVLRLLLERKVALDEILLVTYTEKATGELKDRLRKAIESKLAADSSPLSPVLGGEGSGVRERIAEGPNPLTPTPLPRVRGRGALEADHDSRQRLQAALDSFDQAPILTIHGFCQRLLVEYALEQGQDFRRELINDNDLIEPALREVQRRVWLQDFGPRLPQILDIAQYNRDGAKAWEAKVNDLLSRYRQEFGNVLLPIPNFGDLDLKAREDECRTLLAKLRMLTGPIPNEYQTHSWYTSWLAVKLRQDSKDKRLNFFVTPLLHWLGNKASEDRLLVSYLHFQEKIEAAFKDFSDEKFGVLLCKIPEKTKNEILAQCPGLTDAIEALNEFHQKCGVHRLTHLLAVKTIGEVREKVNDLKNQRGQISFDDMIIHVNKALDAKNRGSREFIAMLRKRFRYAVVDEFQDTDPLQWNIFKRIFLEGGEARLFVVGDPKQAIFGFRGADLPTYHIAAGEMKDKFGAKQETLDTNWRSVPSLLEPLNHLFEKSGWFPVGGPIEYRRVQPPPAKSARTTIEREPAGFASLTIVELQQMDSLKKARRQFSGFVAAEIRRLLDANIKFTVKEKPHTLNASHICCLVLKKNEADPLMAALRLAKLPYTFYKQIGLWSSDQAEHLGIILQALAAPEDRTAFRKTLLTSFFGLGPAELALCDDIPPTHQARNLFHKWLGYVEKRQWAVLSQSLLEDTGILFRDTRDGNLDRVAGNLRFLLGALEEKAYRDNLDLLDLIDYFEKRRRQGDVLENDFQPIETEQPKIKIMTIHAAKGLEFPVVFMAGGFTKKPHFDLTIYRDKQNRRVFDLDPTPDLKARQKTEEQEEYRRLLYVALTRAMLKLYVPLVNDKEITKPYAGPVSTLLRPALLEADLVQFDPKNTVQVDADAVKPPAVVSVVKAITKKLPSLSGPLFPTLPDNLGKRRLVVRSFSSLHRASSPIHFGEEKVYALDEGPDLPDDPFRGPIFGNLVHEVLESIDFAAVGAAVDVGALTKKGSPLRAVLNIPVGKHLPMMRGRAPLEQLHEACVQEVADLVWKALRTPLPGLGSRLADIPRDQRIHELEFLFPQHFGATAEVRLEEGFFTGFMDLVFRANGLYYLLDWKTNTLDSYDPPAINQAMEQSEYHRQYRLYLHALRRWLQGRAGPAFDFLKNFGGVYYLFLRGMTGNENGIFYYQPKETDFDLGLVMEP